MFFCFIFFPQNVIFINFVNNQYQEQIFFYPIFFRYSSYKVQIYSEWGTHRPLRAFSLSGYVFP